MKKLLFVLAFAFIGQQAFSQMYMIHISDYETGNCNNSLYELTLTKVDPTGNVTYTCFCKFIDPTNATTFCGNATNALVILNQEFNSLISQGYKLVYGAATNMTPTDGDEIKEGSLWIFAIP